MNTRFFSKNNFQKKSAIPPIGRMFLAALKTMRGGEVTVITPEQERFVFTSEAPSLSTTFILHDWSVIRHLLTRGDVGFAEDYIEGLWETDNLPALLTLATHNIDRLESFFHGRLRHRMWVAFKHWLNRNHKDNSKKNIRAHYDVGNDFYALWLDKTMTYSSALFADAPTLSLEEAQAAKYRRILERLGAQAGEHILEIGCGWGGFAEAAARQGIQVTGITLSHEQESFARARMEKAGLADKVDIRLMDYRDVEGVFDHIVSIEMFEAVGRRYWPVYFDLIRQRLKHGGKVLIQTITIDDAVFEDYASRSDFIQQYTFPGGMLASETVFIKEVENAGLVVKDAYRFGPDYARTLEHWLVAFERAVPAIKAMGYADNFIRQWKFYLSYCIAGFSTGRTNVLQVELTHA